MHPAVTRVGPSPEARRELMTGLRLTVGMGTAAIVAILFLKDVLVRLAYSPAFLDATRLLPVQLFGDFFYFVAFPFTVYALGVSRLRVYLAAWTGYSIVAILASLALIPSLGLMGVPAGYAVSNILGALVSIAWLISRRDEGLGPTLLLIAGGLGIVAIQSLLAWRGQFVLLQATIFVGASAATLAWLWRNRNA
jgi:O-antigen/teichoic acid export membrane protein